MRPPTPDTAPQSAKPRLLFFQRHYDNSVPEFLMAHVREHIRCLSIFFDVVVIDKDCDWLQLCDRHQPDLALFETGSNLSNSRRLRIRNIHANASVTRLALLNADGWAETRAGSVAEMAHWGVENFVSIAVTAAEHLPALAGRLICWPNFVDPDVFRDYGEAKSTPVLLTGALAAQYPWRSRVFKRLAAHYPASEMPHPGYYPDKKAAGVHGEAYARKINAARFVPTCGTIAKEVVRKHFEIPACRSCLITERSGPLSAAGFEDMVNCVFADDGDVVDKLDHLMRNPVELQRITDAGHALVNAKHTLHQRDQIFRWWRLQQDLRAGERIVQPNPFQSPIVMAADCRESPQQVRDLPHHLSSVSRGMQLLAEHRAGDAEMAFRAALANMPLLPEARFGLALCSLQRGDATDARARLLEGIEYTVAQYGAPDPDPIEWAYLVLASLCRGRIRDARRLAGQFENLRHPELDRVRWLIGALSGGGLARFPKLQWAPEDRPSIHRIPDLDLAAWLREIGLLLRVCGQQEWASRVAKMPAPEGLTHPIETPHARMSPGHQDGGSRPTWRGWISDPAVVLRMRHRLRNARHRIGRLAHRVRFI